MYYIQGVEFGHGKAEGKPNVFFVWFHQAGWSNKKKKRNNDNRILVIHFLLGYALRTRAQTTTNLLIS